MLGQSRLQERGQCAHDNSHHVWKRRAKAKRIKNHGLQLRLVNDHRFGAVTMARPGRRTLPVPAPGIRPCFSQRVVIACSRCVAVHSSRRSRRLVRRCEAGHTPSQGTSRSAGEDESHRDFAVVQQCSNHARAFVKQRQWLDVVSVPARKFWRWPAIGTPFGHRMAARTAARLLCGPAAMRGSACMAQAGGATIEARLAHRAARPGSRALRYRPGQRPPVQRRGDQPNCASRLLTTYSGGSEPPEAPGAAQGAAMLPDSSPALLRAGHPLSLGAPLRRLPARSMLNHMIWCPEACRVGAGRHALAVSCRGAPSSRP